MPSFLGKVKDVAIKVYRGGKIAAPFLGVVSPRAKAFFEAAKQLRESIEGAEIEYPEDGQGHIKNGLVVGDFEQSLVISNIALAKRGEVMSYDPEKLQQAIQAQVTANNALGDLVDSMEVKPLAKGLALS